MLSQAIPSTVGPERPVGRGCESSVASARPRRRDGGFAAGAAFLGAERAGHEPLRVEFREPPRRQGARVDPGAVPGRARPRRLRGSLRPSGARRACARRRRQHADGGDRGFPPRLLALFGGARPARDGALRHERDPQGRSGGQGGPHRKPEEPCRHRRRGRLRRARAQVPDLGAECFRGAPVRGAGEGSRAAEILGRRGARAGGTGRSAAMMARAATPVEAAPARHVPVLLPEMLDALAAERGGVFVDGTFGAGGYTQGILAASRRARVVAIDRDPDAIAGGAGMVLKAKGRLALVPARFGDLDRVVLDVGVSSMQLDEAERGFSFRRDGPLDMRMERDGDSAADLVNRASEAELADVFFHFGEERRARAVARAVIERRRKGRIETTGELAELVAGLVRAEPGGIHPATRVFQSLRIAVNDELGELVRALHAAERVLRPGGRLAVVTFHSLEDRIVKQFLAVRTGRAPGLSRHLPRGEAAAASFVAVTKGPVAASEAEAARNPRARSAKLRAAERTEAPPQEPLTALEALASLPDRGARR